MKKTLTLCFILIGFLTTGLAQPKRSTAPADPVEKAKGLQQELRLTNSQRDKIAAIYKESADKFEKIKEEEHGNTNKMLVKIHPLREATVKRIKAVLSTRQSMKYDALLKQTKNPGVNGGWSDGWS